MLTKEEFIQECAMRNLSQCFSQMYTSDCNDTQTVTNCYNAAIRLADIIYDKL